MKQNKRPIRILKTKNKIKYTPYQYPEKSNQELVLHGH